MAKVHKKSDQNTAQSDIMPLPESRAAKDRTPLRSRLGRNWAKLLGLSFGTLALIMIVLSGVLSQYYKGRVMPGVVVAGQPSGAQRAAEIKAALDERTEDIRVTFVLGEKILEPAAKDIGLRFDTDKAVRQAMRAKRDSNILTRAAFWRPADITVEASVDRKLLSQYLQMHTNGMVKPPKDARLVFREQLQRFAITKQADGEALDIDKAVHDTQLIGKDLQSRKVDVALSKQPPKITETKLRPLVESADELVRRKIVLTNAGVAYEATPADIASWLTPTPQKDGSMELVIDPAKIQGYVAEVGKLVARPPVDKKVLKDKDGKEFVLQEGRDGMQLTDQSVLANAITLALEKRQDSTQLMNITIARHKVVSMDAYDKWIEVDLSEQRTTAYEGSKPVRSFVVSTGIPGTVYETITGEFAIWHKTRVQTMTGGSRADGSYYSTPNVEWVSYFYKDYALHGAWWHNDFGTPRSKGCVNLRNEDAEWLWHWAPMGTKVIVHQ